MTTTTSKAARHAPSASKNGSAVAVPHLSVAERVARGKAARAEVPRSRHAAFEPSPDRVDPVTLLERQAETRVPELVPIRYGRMLVSPFTFYRGAALIMAQDLGPTPRSGLNVQCCGDAHLSNFGVFASPERRLVFDVNDFDETLPGPWEWDVKRLAVSMLVAARDNGYRTKDEERIVLGTIARYRTAMAEFAGMKNLDVWYARLEIESALQELAPQFKQKMVKRTEKAIAKARTKDSMTAFSKLTQQVNGDTRIVDQSPLIVPIEQLAQGHERDEMFEALQQLLRGYRQTLEFDRRTLLEQFRLTDFARKVVGVGSVGTRAWIALLLGRDGQDPLFLQMKEAEASVLEEILGPSEFSNTASASSPASASCRPPATSSSAGSTSTRGWTRSGATSTGASSRTGRAQQRSSRWSPKPWPRTARCAAGRWRVLTPAAATGSPSRPTSARATASTRRSWRSRKCTPNRTNATTNSSRRQSSPGGSPPRQGSNRSDL